MILTKKIELWIVIVIVIILSLFSILYGTAVYLNLSGSTKALTITKIAHDIAKFPIEAIKFLINHEPPSVFVYEKEKGNYRFQDYDEFFFNEKLNINSMILIPKTSKNEWEILLVDLKNKKKLNSYRVQTNILNATDQYRSNKKDLVNGLSSVPRAPRIDNNLNLTFISNNGLLIQVDQKLQTRWVNADFDFHHTFNFSSEQEYLWAIGSDISKKSKLDDKYDYDFLNDLAIKINPITGETIEFYSITNALIESNLHNHIFIGRQDEPFKDPLHMNDVQPVLEDGPFFKKGDIFISLAHPNMVLLYDTKDKKIKWNTTEGLFHQHDVDILNNNQIGIFNNRRIFTSFDQVDGYNQILIYDFEKKRFNNFAEKEIKKHSIRTVSQGLFNISDNSILIEETNWGRLLLFDRNHNLLFRYISKDDLGRNHQLGWSSYIDSQDIINQLRKIYLKK